MPRAGEHVAVEVSLGHRRAAMGALGVEGDDHAAVTEDDDRCAVDHRAPRVVGDLRDRHHRRPLGWRVPERGVVDAEPGAPQQVTAQVAAHRRCGRAHESERDAAPVAAALALHPRRAVAEQRGRVRRRVHEADAPVRTHLVRPVGRAGGHGRQRREHAPRDQAGGRPARVPSAEQIESERRRPEADREVGEHRVNRVAQPRPAEHVLDGPGADDPGDAFADRARHAVEGRLLAQLLDQAGQRGAGCSEFPVVHRRCAYPVVGTGETWSAPLSVARARAGRRRGAAGTG